MRDATVDEFQVLLEPQDPSHDAASPLLAARVSRHEADHDAPLCIETTCSSPFPGRTGLQGKLESGTRRSTGIRRAQCSSARLRLSGLERSTINGQNRNHRSRTLVLLQSGPRPSTAPRIRTRLSMVAASMVLSKTNSGNSVTGQA